MNETIVPDITNPKLYWQSVLNPDWSRVGSAWWSTYKMQAYYNADATYEYEYYCEANYNTALSDTKWRIYRVRTLVSTGKFYDKTFTWMTFNKAATNLTIVEGYTYN